MTYVPPSGDRPFTYQGTTYTSQVALGAKLREEYHLRTTQDITSCSTCHR